MRTSTWVRAKVTWSSFVAILSIGLMEGLPMSAQATEPGKTIGKIHRFDPRFDALVAPDAQIEVLAEGFDWTEGPLWLPTESVLLFSDIPTNKVHRWSPKEGLSLFLHPSGYTGTKPRGGEPGSNGLLLDLDGNIILCQHGDRCLARLTTDKKFERIATHYQGKRFNSPNDAALHSSGAIYFTDPPYGLEGNNNDPEKELPFNGVFRLAPDGEITLLTDQIPFPNGIAFSPDEKILYVASSNPKHAVWYRFPVRKDGTLGQGSIFADMTERVGKVPGLPDGMKVDQAGNLFATGPGGVHVFAPDGTLLGTIETGEKTANCAFGGSNNGTLYITADMYLCSIPTLTQGHATPTRSPAR